MRNFPANSLEVFKNRIESSIKIGFNKVLQRYKETKLPKPPKIPSSSNSAKASDSNSFSFPNANCYSLPQIQADPLLSEQQKGKFTAVILPHETESTVIIKKQ